MKLIAWFLKFARAEKDETYSHHLVALILTIATSVIVVIITENQFHKDPSFNLGVGVCWVVLWTIIIWKPWRSAPEFDLEKDKEKKD